MSTFAFDVKTKCGRLFLLLIAVSTFLLQTTNAETFQLTVTRGQHNFYFPEQARENQFLNLSTYNPLDAYGFDSFHIYENEESEEDKDNSTTIILVKNSELPTQLSQTAMDIITIVWYVATFLALAAFFLLMTCTDRRNQANGNGNSAETPRAPPSPSPSYSEFAPPSYETVMKMQLAAKSSIFVIPFPVDDMNKDNTNTTATTISTISTTTNANNNTANNVAESTPATTPVINFYTINELQKLGS